jgi:hypothetical protein
MLRCPDNIASVGRAAPAVSVAIGGEPADVIPSSDERIEHQRAGDGGGLRDYFFLQPGAGCARSVVTPAVCPAVWPEGALESVPGGRDGILEEPRTRIRWTVAVAARDDRAAQQNSGIETHELS